MIFVVGLSHKTAPIDVRERLAMSDEGRDALLSELRKEKELRETLLLSTCNRVELFAHSPEPQEKALQRLREAFHRLSPTGLSAHLLYEKVGSAAIEHIFRVTASLDSLVLGEPQILGQVKEALDVATRSGNVGHVLGRCMQRAISVGKRVRTETALGQGTVSVSSVAVDLAKSIFSDLTEHAVLLVGAGEMAEAAAKSLGRGARAMRVCNRSFERGATLARAFGGAAVSWEMLEEELSVADVVVTSTASKTPVITSTMVKRAMRVRRGRPLFFVDIAVPRNVEPDVHKLENVYVYNVDDLEEEVSRGMTLRQGELVRADAIVKEEAQAFQSWSLSLGVKPTVVALRARTRAVLGAELARTLKGRLRHLSEGDRTALSQMMKSVESKLLHAPTSKLQNHTSPEEARALAAVVAELFDLPEHPPSEEEAESPLGDADDEVRH